MISLSSIILKVEHNSLNNKCIEISGEYGKCFPEKIQLSLTNLCRHKCIHCYKGDVIEIKNLDIAYILKLLNFVKGKTKHIQLTGGEPLMYTNFFNIIEEYSNDFIFSITTSGCVSINNKLLITLKKFNTVQVSLYGIDENIHDSFANRKGSFKCVISNINKMVSHGIRVDVSTIVTKNNIDMIEQFIIFCIKMKVSSVIFGKMSKVGRAVKLNGYYLSSENEKYVEDKLKEYSSKYNSKINIMLWSNKKSISSSKIFKCGAGITQWVIKEDGKILPCNLVDSEFFNMGSLYNEDYIKIINSEDYIKNIHLKWEENICKIKETYEKSNIITNDICENININGGT